MWKKQVTSMAERMVMQISLLKTGPQILLYDRAFIRVIKVLYYKKVISEILSVYANLILYLIKNLWSNRTCLFFHDSRQIRYPWLLTLTLYVYRMKAWMNVSIFHDSEQTESNWEATGGFGVLQSLKQIVHMLVCKFAWGLVKCGIEIHYNFGNFNISIS